MDGNVYIQLSLEKYNVESEQQDKICSVVYETIWPHYSKELRVRLIDIPTLNGIEVLVMDQASGFTDIIQEEIKDVLMANIPTVRKADIRVRMNYLQWNPGFTARYECLPFLKITRAMINKMPVEYYAEETRFSLDQVELSEKTSDQLTSAINRIEAEEKVFEEWGLGSMIPKPIPALVFCGPSGIGKMMAAEAVAHALGKKIICETYADIKRNINGKGPKMLKSLFICAEKADAVVFLDEADDFLAELLTESSGDPSLAANRLRSQALSGLEYFNGTVIFAAEHAVECRKPFFVRFTNIEFELPTVKERTYLWLRCLKSELIHVPAMGKVDLLTLAQKYEFSEREIKLAVKNACLTAALEGRNGIDQADLLKACEECSRGGSE